MDNRRVRTEFFDIVGDAIIETRTHCQNNIGMMHSHVGFISTMHTKHT